MTVLVTKKNYFSRFRNNSEQKSKPFVACFYKISLAYILFDKTFCS